MLASACARLSKRRAADPGLEPSQSGQEIKGCRRIFLAMQSYHLHLHPTRCRRTQLYQMLLNQVDAALVEHQHRNLVVAYTHAKTMA